MIVLDGYRNSDITGYANLYQGSGDEKHAAWPYKWPKIHLDSCTVYKLWINSCS